MLKYDPTNPAHVRANKAIQGYLWTLREAGLDVVDEQELLKLRGRVLHLEAELEVTHQLYEAQNEALALIPECPDHGIGCLSHKKEWITARLEAGNSNGGGNKPQRPGKGRRNKNVS
jgi:hypothetical protein